MENSRFKFRAWVEQPGTNIRYFHYFNINSMVPSRLSVVAYNQFTGLHDKNGKEIYEGDIVKTKFGIIGDIQFLDGCFCLHREYADDCLSYYTNLTVIGNIYENPELSSLAAG